MHWELSPAQSGSDGLNEGCVESCSENQIQILWWRKELLSCSHSLPHSLSIWFCAVSLSYTDAAALDGLDSPSVGMWWGWEVGCRLSVFAESRHPGYWDVQVLHQAKTEEFDALDNHSLDNTRRWRWQVLQPVCSVTLALLLSRSRSLFPLSFTLLSLFVSFVQRAHNNAYMLRTVKL